jgi:hypothetical protein
MSAAISLLAGLVTDLAVIVLLAYGVHFRLVRDLTVVDVRSQEPASHPGGRPQPARRLGPLSS